MDEDPMSQNKTFWLGLIVTAVAFYILNSLSAILFPFFMGLIGAYAFNHLVIGLEKYHISRGLGSAIVILGVLISFALLVIVFLPLLQRELFILARSMPAVVENWASVMKPFLEKSAAELGTPSAAEVKAQVTSHMGDIINWSIKIITNILTNGLALANILSLVILTPIIMFYLLKDWPKLVNHLDQCIPLKQRATVHFYARRIDTTLSAFAKGQGLVCLILMVMYSISLWAIGVPHGFFLGIMTGLMSFIPYVGMFTGLTATLAISLANFESWHQILLVIVTFVAIGAIEGNVISPRLIGDKVGLHPVWIIFALLASATWFGFLGVIVALPVAAVLGVIVRILLQWYKTSRFYSGGGSIGQ